MNLFKYLQYLMQLSRNMQAGSGRLVNCLRTLRESAWDSQAKRLQTTYRQRITVSSSFLLIIIGGVLRLIHNVYFLITNSNIDQN